MNVNRHALSAAMLLAAGAGAAPARAQFGVTPRGRASEGAARRTLAPYGSVSIYPFAPFTASGTFPDGTSGTRTEQGRITAVDIGLTPPTSRTPFEVGGWFWSRGGSFEPWKGSGDFYQIHARGYFTTTRELGLQVAGLSSSKSGGRAITLSLLYELSKERVAPKSRTDWVIQVGLGQYIDYQGGRRTEDVSAFVQGSVDIGYHLTFNASEWYFRSRNLDLNRFAAGIGYNF